jgi:hypothetical protein
VNPVGRNRFAVTWGRLPDMGDHPDRLCCHACGCELPARAAEQCMECAHAWRWGWILSLHNAWPWWRMGPTLNDG